LAWARNFSHHRFRFRPVERAASGRPYDFAFDVAPSHRGTGRFRFRPRTLQSSMIGGDAQGSAVEVAIGKRNDVAVRAVMVAQVDDVFVAAPAAGEIEQRVHRIGPGGVPFGESVRRQHQAILLWRYGADVLEL
jgi:hypothetical protein